MRDRGDQKQEQHGREYGVQWGISCAADDSAGWGDRRVGRARGVVLLPRPGVLPRAARLLRARVPSRPRMSRVPARVLRCHDPGLCLCRRRRFPGLPGLPPVVPGAAILQPCARQWDSANDFVGQLGIRIHDDLHGHIEIVALALRLLGLLLRRRAAGQQIQRQERCGLHSAALMIPARWGGGKLTCVARHHVVEHFHVSYREVDRHSPRAAAVLDDRDQLAFARGARHDRQRQQIAAPLQAGPPVDLTFVVESIEHHTPRGDDANRRVIETAFGVDQHVDGACFMQGEGDGSRLGRVDGSQQYRL